MVCNHPVIVFFVDIFNNKKLLIKLMMAVTDRI